MCKTAIADQAQLEQLEAWADVVRHSECGHVLTYRAGGALELLKPYVPDQHGQTLPYALPPVAGCPECDALGMALDEP